MSMRFRPRLEGLETRSVPASLFASALEWAPNPATDCPARVMEHQPEESTPSAAVVWDIAPSATGVLSVPDADDSVWTGFQAEHVGYGNENLLTDWLFAEEATSAA
jgi:hypothetical protein